MIDIQNSYLPSSNYIGKKRKKKQIVIGEVYPTFMKSIWRNGGKHKGIPHYSISFDGQITQYFDNNYFSYYLDSMIDENVITIGLENIGTLTKIGNHYYDVFNNEYKDNVFNAKWKSLHYWQQYPEIQLLKTIELCRYLLLECDIECSVIDNNYFNEQIDSFKGICYRSNHDIKHNDLNPSWNFDNFKQSIEHG